jgi:hypothetical protein
VPPLPVPVPEQEGATSISYESSLAKLQKLEVPLDSDVLVGNFKTEELQCLLKVCVIRTTVCELLPDPLNKISVAADQWCSVQQAPQERKFR